MTRLLALLAGAILLAGCDAPDVRSALAEESDPPAAVTTGDLDSGPRRVWRRAGSFATPSPDGRLVAFVDWTSGDVAVHDLLTGEDRRITDKGTWRENGSWAEYMTFSPDGDRVAYTYGNVLTGDPYRYELRYVELGDTTQHLVYAAEKASGLRPTDWSEEAGILLELHGTDETVLTLADPDGGGLEEVATLPLPEDHTHEGSDGSFSPDSRFIAYRQGDQAVVQPLDGGRESRLGVGVDRVLGWVPDGDGLLVHTDHDGQSGIWLAPFEAGRFTGELRLVRGGIPHLGPSGFADSGYYYTVMVDAPKVHLASVDVENGRMLSQPTAITSPVDGMALLAEWSPDGGSLAYALRTPDRFTIKLMVRGTEGEAVRELATFPAASLDGLSWSADGESIYVVAPGPPKLVRVDVRSGTTTVLEKPFRNVDGIAAVDDRTLLVSREDGPEQNVDVGLYEYDLETGAEEMLYALPAKSNTVSVSPDGRRVAVATRGRDGDATRVTVVPIEGGSARDVARASHPVHFELSQKQLPWTSDGEYLLVGRGESGVEGSHELVAVSVDDGGIKMLPLDAPGGRIESPTLHPDGRRLAWVAGEERQELWVLEDLTPEE